MVCELMGCFAAALRFGAFEGHFWVVGWYTTPTLPSKVCWGLCDGDVDSMGGVSWWVGWDGVCGIYDGEYRLVCDSYCGGVAAREGLGAVVSSILGRVSW